MKKFCAPLILVALAGLWACGPGDGSSPEGSVVEDVPAPDERTMRTIARIENSLLPRIRVEGEPGWTLGERMDRWNIEAVSVAVIDDYRIAWAKAWGVADRETGAPATPETLFQAGSISKPVAATGALRMVELGMLDLNVPVDSFLTSWQLPDNELTEREPVTIRRLLSHTAGTTVHGFPGYAPWEPVPTVPQVLDGLPPANTAAVRVDILPGSQVRYSGGGTTIVQLAMTDVSGESFPALLKQLVLEPAGMVLSTYQNPLPDERLPEAAAGYHRNGGAVPGKRHTYPEMAAAGLWTTPTDLARFALTIQKSLRGGDGGVLSPETAREMLTPVLESAGLGFFVENREGTTYFQHGGADEGFQALLLASRDGGRGIAVMANSDNGGAIATEIMRAVALEYGWPGLLEDPVEAVRVSPAELAGYAGRYALGPAQVARLTVEDGELVGRVSLQDFSSRLYPLGDDLFLSDELGARLRFVRDASGEITGIESADRPGADSWPRLAEGEVLPVEHLDAGRTAEAIAALEDRAEQAGLAAVVASEEQVNLLGYALIEAGRFQQSAVVFRWNADRHPNHANPWDSLADGLLAAGDTVGAVEAYRQVLRAIPRDPEADPEALRNLEQRARAGIQRYGER